MDLKLEDCVVPIGKSKSIVNYFNNFVDSFTYQKYHTFMFHQVPNALIEEEDILKKINNKFPIKHMGISKVPPFTNYKWHCDLYRGLGINMLLQSQRSQVFFGESVPNETWVSEFLEINYQPETFYLFNTQTEHTVFNFEGYRYLFTLEFEQDKTELNYYDVLKYYESL
jgi:hypothetical protein